MCIAWAPPQPELSAWEIDLLWSSLLVLKLLPDNANLLLPASVSDRPTARALSWLATSRLCGRRIAIWAPCHGSAVDPRGRACLRGGCCAHSCRRCRGCGPACSHPAAWLSTAVYPSCRARLRDGCRGRCRRRYRSYGSASWPACSARTARCSPVLQGPPGSPPCWPLHTTKHSSQATFLGRIICMTVSQKLAQQAQPQGPCWPPLRNSMCIGVCPGQQNANHGCHCGGGGTRCGENWGVQSRP